MFGRKGHPDLEKDIAAVADRIRAVEQTLQDLASDNRRHGLDIVDTQERLRSAIGRFSQRFRDEKKQNGTPPDEPTEELSLDERIRKGLLT
jgi:hypothetical protein